MRWCSCQAGTKGIGTGREGIRAVLPTGIGGYSLTFLLKA
jgi:hypothetical protein